MEPYRSLYTLASGRCSFINPAFTNTAVAGSLIYGLSPTATTILQGPVKPISVSNF